jgi:uncharacterized membrane protein YfcA
MAMAYPSLVPGPVLLVAGCFACLTVWRESGHLDYRVAGWTIAGRLLGSIGAGAIIGWLPREVFGLFFAVLILAAVALSLSGWRVRAAPRTLFIAGVSSGVMGTMTSAGGPPLGIAMQNLEPARLRANVGLCLAAGAFFSMAVLAAVGRFGPREFEMGALLLAPALLGFAVSPPLARRVSARGVRYLVLAVSAASALVLLARY